jgi:hypothetical protein
MGLIPIGIKNGVMLISLLVAIAAYIIVDVYHYTGNVWLLILKYTFIGGMVAFVVALALIFIIGLIYSVLEELFDNNKRW